MKARDYIRDYGKNIKYNVDEVDINDKNAFNEFSDPLKKWWCQEFGQYVDQNNGFFTPPQKEAIPTISKNKNTLIASPTGSGKTLSAFSTQINRLFDRAVNNELENSVYCLYISPLKSLANDINRNLKKPLDGIDEFTHSNTQNIRHAIRHGDTPDKKRREMLNKTPHILNTTPETLAILLNSPKFKEKLKTVETVIVDEIHSLASNKRGVHLSLSLERLQNISDTDITRIGCSATVDPLDEIGHYLVGHNKDKDQPRDFEIVDKRFVRDTELKVHTPVDDLINTSQEEISSKFYDKLHNHIQKHSTTLVFTNTRSGAESTLTNLRDNYNDYDQNNSAVHHGSLGKDERRQVEKDLKNGNLRVVTTSTSLELGIDMGDIDLVAQIGSPKSIASLLQRIGRAGHQIGETVEGRLFVLNRDELVECTTMAKQANDGYIDRVFIPEKCQDVATQQVYGMAINRIWSEDEMLDTIQSAYPYREYTRDDFHTLLRYMSADYEDMEERNVYPKVWWDQNDDVNGEHHYSQYPVGETLIGKRGKRARVIYYTNIGTIPDSFSCSIHIRGEDVWVGELDEEYLNTLDKGDVFQLGGKNYKYKYRRGSKVYVDRTSKAPTVPSWFSERLPLSYDLGSKIVDFQDKFVSKVKNNEVQEWLEEFPIDQNTIKALIRLYKNQMSFVGKSDTPVSTSSNYILEEVHDEDKQKTNYYFQSCYGRKFNNGMSRLLAQYFAEEKNINVQVAVNDQGFSLETPVKSNLDISSAIKNINVDDIRNILKKSLEGTDFIKRYFRINSTRSLMILTNYKGSHKSAKQQQVKSEMLLGFSEELDDFAVINETYREIMEDKLNIDMIELFVSDVQSGNINIEKINLDVPSPRSFETAALASDDVISAKNESEALKRFQEKVLSQIQ